MNASDSLTESLRRHLALCQEILALEQRESLSLRAAAPGLELEIYQAKEGLNQTRKELLSRLGQSMNLLRQHRNPGLKAGTVERAVTVEVAALLRQNQDLIMKIIVLDRENEQALLRKGLVPPRHLPSVCRQRPHFVADMYRRQRP